MKEAIFMGLMTQTSNTMKSPLTNLKLCLTVDHETFESKIDSHESQFFYSVFFFFFIVLPFRQAIYIFFFN